MRISCMRVCDVTSTKGHCFQKRPISRMNGISCIPCGMTFSHIYGKTRVPDD